MSEHLPYIATINIMFFLTVFEMVRSAVTLFA
jgi:hypothetical protein